MSLIAIAFGLVMLFIFMMQGQSKINHASRESGRKNVFYIKKTLWLLMFVLLLLCGGWVSLRTLPQFWGKVITNQGNYDIILDVSSALLFIVLYLVIASIINSIFAYLASRERNKFLSSFLPLKSALKVAVFLLLVREAFSFIGVSEGWVENFRPVNQAVIIGAIGWSLIQCIQVGEAFFIEHNRHQLKDTLSSRRAYTHITIIKRILMILVTVMTIAAILLRFDHIRAAGTAVLASAGVMATIVGLSARGLLENIFKGLQLAIAQPIRLDDTVTVSGETGTVTDISLHHVVLTLSDRSQMIVPTNEFLDKIFKNWTHCSDDLLGHVIFYVNFNVSIETLRKKFQEMLETNQYWDHGVGELNVSDFKNRSVELKLVMSAKSVSDLGRLRNEIREKMLEYMQTHHADGLPS